MHSQSLLLLFCFWFGHSVELQHKSAVVSSQVIETSDLVTKTVYGFLDFTTTIGKTIMIFSPQSAPSLELLQVPSKVVNIIQTKPFNNQEKSTQIIPTKLHTKEKESKNVAIQTTALAQKVYVNQPDYDLLSRQPEAYAEESYHVVDLISKKKNGSKKNTANKSPHPVGLVTTLSGKVAMDGTTTIHETSVIGTYISGKYAQVLQSNSHVLSPTKASHNLISSTLRPNHGLGRIKQKSHTDEHRTSTLTTESNTYYNNRRRSSTGKHKLKSHHKNGQGGKTLRGSHRDRERERENDISSTTSNDSKKYAFRQRPQTVSTTTNAAAISVKRPVGRWQYKSSLKPRVYIRKSSDFSNLISPSKTISAVEIDTINLSSVESMPQSARLIIDNLPDNNTNEDQQTQYPIETINIDIISPSNSEDIYYEVATIKTPYTFQVGSLKKTRYITVTSTTEKSFYKNYFEKSTIKGPLIENILTSTTPINQLLKASSITTFPVCTLADSTETPSLEEFVETLTQSQIKYKTQVFPVEAVNQSVKYFTLVQTYGVTTLITATKTTPACVGNNFFELNTKLEESGSELHLDLEFGDLANNEKDADNNTDPFEVFPASTFAYETTENKPSNNDKTQIYQPSLSPEQLQQLAYLKLYQQGPQLTQEMIPNAYESHLMPSIPGRLPGYRTEIPNSPPQPLPSINPFVFQQPQFKVVTQETLRPTILTQTLSRILKLTFGAKTALTTIYSTNIVSTDIPSIYTTTLPVQQTAAYPNFFPPVFPQFPLIG